MQRAALRGLPALTLALLGLLHPVAQAQLFEDTPARKAIQQLREQAKEVDAAAAAQKAVIEEQAAQLQTLRKALLDLNTQIEQLRTEMARQRGPVEQLARDLSEVQRQQKDLLQSVDERVRRLEQGLDERVRRIEPAKVALDGREFMADPAEKRQYEEAVALLGSGEFAQAATSLSAFVKRYPSSGYLETAQFWLGNALYGKRDYRDAIKAFTVTASAAGHPRAPEALLAIASCQIEMKDLKSARATLADIGKQHPQSEAAKVAKERLASLPAR